MSDKKFRDGNLAWCAARMSGEDLINVHLQSDWQDGFAAFSTTEERLGKDGPARLRRFLVGKAEEQGGPEGFFMEAGLWSTFKDGYEELFFEREGDSFFVQHWRLAIKPKAGQENCYFRQTPQTFVRGNIKTITGVPGGDLSTIEVIVPEERLRFYLTRGK